MPTSESEGSQTAVISTEHTLDTITTAGTYVLNVDTSNMVTADFLILRVKEKIRSTGTTRLAYWSTYFCTQSANADLSIPVASLNEYVVTLEQTEGTGRAYNWEIASL